MSRQADTTKLFRELQGRPKARPAPQTPAPGREQAIRARVSPEPLKSQTLFQAFQVAVERAGPTRPRRLSRQEERIALERKWALTYPDDGLPQDLEALRRVIPSGLGKLEVRAFLLGSLEEAKHAYLRLFNQSRTKRELARRCREAGLAHALLGFEAKTRKEIEGAIRFLPD